MTQKPNGETIRQAIARIKQRAAASCLIVTTAQSLAGAEKKSPAKRKNKASRAKTWGQ